MAEKKQIPHTSIGQKEHHVGTVSRSVPNPSKKKLVEQQSVVPASATVPKADKKEYTPQEVVALYRELREKKKTLKLKRSLRLNAYTEELNAIKSAGPQDPIEYHIGKVRALITKAAWFLSNGADAKAFIRTEAYIVSGIEETKAIVLSIADGIYVPSQGNSK